MSVTAKDIARELNLSPSAVSMALNNRPGVSTKTRTLVIETAERMGYDFSRLDIGKTQCNISFIYCHSSAAILTYKPIFDEILQGAIQESKEHSCRLKVTHLYTHQSDLKQQIENFRTADCLGIALLGTEMSPEMVQHFLDLSLPVVIVDTNLEQLDCTCVLMNNVQGAYRATDYLISKRQAQPGYLKSSVPLRNFDERHEGFMRALRANGMHPSQSIVHTLPPTIEGACMEMTEILERHDPLASCYFAENDLIAIGSMKAFRQKGYRIPDDVAFVGFDNIHEARVGDPPLTTVSIPRVYMGRVAVRELLQQSSEPVPHHLRIEVSGSLIRRNST